MDRAPRAPEMDPDVLEDLGDEIATLAAHIHAATHRLLLLIARFDRLRGWEFGGHPTCAHWLAFRTGFDLGTAREHVRVARALEQLPRTSECMARGELSFSKARALTRVAEPASEAALLELGRGCTTAQLECRVRAWRKGSRQDEAARERERHRSRTLSVFPDDDGMYIVRGRLTPEVGAVLMRAIEAAGDALYRETPFDGADTDREAARLRADAIGLLAERGLAAGFGAMTGDAPISGTRAERYQALVFVDEVVLRNVADAESPVSAETQGDSAVPVEVRRHADVSAETQRESAVPVEVHRYADVSAETQCAPVVSVEAPRHPHVSPETPPGGVPSSESPANPAASAEAHREPAEIPSAGRSELADGTRLAAETARRLCCDIGVVRVRRGPDGSSMDVGRKTRSIPPALRRALEARDRGCRFPGCGRRFTDGHHVRHWADGGPTSLANCLLLCRFHHRLVHEGGWRVSWWGEGRPVFIDPRGHEHFDGAWAPPTLTADPVETLVRGNRRSGACPDARSAGARWRSEMDIPLDVLFGAEEAVA